MKLKTVLTVLLSIAAGATVGALWLAVGVWPTTGQGEQPSDPLADAQIEQPVDAGGEAQTAPAEHAEDGDLLVLRQSDLHGLVHDSDIVIVGTVLAQADQTSSVVSEGMVAIHANYTLEPDQYLKGSGGATLDFRLTVAHNIKDEQRDYAVAVQSADPLTVGDRYIFFLRWTRDGRVTLAAEPGRFKIEDAIASVESTVAMAGGHTMDFSDTFPSRSLADLIEDIVSAAAAPAPTPPTPSEPAHEHAPHEDDF